MKKTWYASEEVSLAGVSLDPPGTTAAPGVAISTGASPSEASVVDSGPTEEMVADSEVTLLIVACSIACWGFSMQSVERKDVVSNGNAGHRTAAIIPSVVAVLCRQGPTIGVLKARNVNGN
jgi:hypothetical protein